MGRISLIETQEQKETDINRLLSETPFSLSCFFPSAKVMALLTMGWVCLHQLIIKTTSTYLLICHPGLDNSPLKLLNVMLGRFNFPILLNLFYLVLLHFPKFHTWVLYLHHFNPHSLLHFLCPSYSLPHSLLLISANRLYSSFLSEVHEITQTETWSRIQGRMLFAGSLPITCLVSLLVPMPAAQQIRIIPQLRLPSWDNFVKSWMDRWISLGQLPTSHSVSVVLLWNMFKPLSQNILFF